jgi:hypothetical protein
VENTGYLGGASTVVPTETTANGTAGIDLPSLGSASVYHGTIVLDLQDAADFRWVASINVAKSDSGDVVVGGYSKALSAELTQLTVGTVAGTANGDAGEINISYEF